jgi:copper transport protein
MLGVTGTAGAELVLVRARERIPESLRSEIRRRALRWGMAGAWLVVVAAVGRLLAQVSAASDPSEPYTETLRAVLASRWGSRWVIQSAVACLAVGLCLFALRRTPRRYLQGIAAILIAFTWPLTGHAMDFPLGAVWGVLAQGMHVLAIALWIGTLGVVLASATPPVRRAPADDRRTVVLALVTTFSPLALIAAGTAVFAGGVLAVANVRSADALFHSAYGQMLLRKLFFVAATAALGAYNWRRVQPALRRADASPRLLRSAVAEVTVALVILVFTALLSAMDAPGIG